MQKLANVLAPEMAPEFSRAYYRTMLRAALRQGYRFLFFDEFTPEAEQPSILMRHDIDLSLNDAYELARLEKEEGVKATYFWRLNSTFYSPLSQHDHPKIRAIHDEMGHAPGLHFDPVFYEASGLSLLQGIRRDKNILEQILGCEVKVMSQHRPATTGMTMPTAEEMALIGLYAYDNRFMHQIKYISDSCGQWREGDLIQHLGHHKHIQVLVHPVWWQDEPMAWEKCLSGVEDYAVNAITSKMKTFIERNREYLERRKREGL